MMASEDDNEDDNTHCSRIREIRTSTPSPLHDIESFMPLSEHISLEDIDPDFPFDLQPQFPEAFDDANQRQPLDIECSLEGKETSGIFESCQDLTDSIPETNIAFNRVLSSCSARDEVDTVVNFGNKDTATILSRGEADNDNVCLNDNNNKNNDVSSPENYVGANTTIEPLPLPFSFSDKFLDDIDYSHAADAITKSLIPASDDAANAIWEESLMRGTSNQIHGAVLNCGKRNRSFIATTSPTTPALQKPTLTQIIQGTSLEEQQKQASVCSVKMEETKDSSVSSNRTKSNIGSEREDVSQALSGKVQTQTQSTYDNKETLPGGSMSKQKRPVGRPKGRTNNRTQKETKTKSSKVSLATRNPLLQTVFENISN